MATYPKKIGLILPLFFFFAVTCLVTFPLIFHLTTLIPGRGDQLLVTYIMNWDIHALLHDPLHIFNASIFYPYKNTLAYSDTFFTSAVLGSIPFFITHQPGVFYSWNLILSLTLLSYFTYLLVFYLTKSQYASSVSGVLISFSIFTIAKTSVLQLVSIQWVPLASLFLLLFLKRRKEIFYYLFCLVFLLQVYNSFLPGFFIIFSAVITLLFYGSRIVLRKEVLLASLVTFLLLLPLVIPYYAVSQEFKYVRDIRDTIAFANRIDFSFFPSGETILEKPILSLFYGHNTNVIIYIGYLGLMFYLLLFFSFGYVAVSWKKLEKKILLCFASVAALGYILSLGPALQWGDHVIKKPFIIPLPYVIFYYLVPGFKGIRNSGRWEMLAVLGASIVVGIVLAKFFERKSRVYVLSFTLLVLLGILLEVHLPVRFSTIPEKEKFPKTYWYLASLPEKEPIIEMPLFSWAMEPYANVEFQREYFSTIHFHPTANGYSGFSPIPWEERAKEYLWNFPDDQSVNYFKSIGLRYIILHKSGYDTLEKKGYTIQKRRVRTWEELQTGLKKYPFIQLVKTIGEDYVYKIQGENR